MDDTGRNDLWLSRLIDIGVAIFIGLFIALSLWLWMGTGDSVALAALLSGLPSCF